MGRDQSIRILDRARSDRRHSASWRHFGTFDEESRRHSHRRRYCGGGAVIRKAVKANPELQSYRALREGRIVGVPYYCRPLEWQAPMILERWADALML